NKACCQNRSSAGWLTIDGWIQHGNKSPFKVWRPGHREHGRPSRFGSPKRTGQLQKVRRIVVGVDTPIQDNVVAGMLALRAKLPAQPPEERFEPVDGASHFRGDLNNPVETLDVREFVPENDTDTIFRKFPGLTRKQNAWSEKTECSENIAFTLQH